MDEFFFSDAVIEPNDRMVDVSCQSAPVKTEKRPKCEVLEFKQRRIKRIPSIPDDQWNWPKRANGPPCE